MVIPDDLGEKLLWAADENPWLEVTVDVENRRLVVPELGIDVEFPLDDFTQYRLLEGLDDIGLTLRHDDAVAAYEAKRPLWMPEIATVT